MNKLKEIDNCFKVTCPKDFNCKPPFKLQTIEKTFEFAYSMAFGHGEHRDHRSGGGLNRSKGQIFINTFQGKLSELAIYNVFKKKNKKVYDKLSAPDFDIYGLGSWDDSDIILDDVKFSVKSTKYYGNLLLLEMEDWNANAEYIPNLKSNKSYKYDYFILVRIKPDGESIMKHKKLLYSNNIAKQELYSVISSQSWKYDIPGYITNDDLKSLIKNNFILPKGSLLNGKIPMDADNYYIQSGDMKDLEELLINI